MNGRLFIDGKDAFLAYGLFVENGGYKDVIRLPSFKNLDSTEWAEYNGIEVDLTSPVLDNKSFSIPFCVTDVEKFEALIEVLSDGVYHIFRFKEVNKVCKLRLTTNGSLSYGKKIGKLSLSFVEDEVSLPTGEPLTETDVAQADYWLDDINLANLGVWVLSGSDESIRKAANVRENLKQTSQYKHGVLYDTEWVKFKAKDITLKLLIHTNTEVEFRKRWNAFFGQLLKPNEHYFTFSKVGLNYECYYKSSSVAKYEVLQNGHIWCEFSVVLNVINPKNSGKTKILDTEDDRHIVTEDSDGNKGIEVKDGN